MKTIIVFSVVLSIILTWMMGCSKEKECIQCNDTTGYTLYCKEDDNTLRVMQNGFASSIKDAKEFNAKSADDALTLLKMNPGCRP